MAPVKLPQYVNLKGDNGCYLARPEGDSYLRFNSTERDNRSTHEVFPVEDQENVVMLKNVEVSAFWRRSGNWIWPDTESKPGASQKDCLFQLYQISPTVLSLKCLGNDMFVKRLTEKGKDNGLNACLSGSDNKLAQFVVSEGILARRVFHVEYMFDRLEKVDATPIILGESGGTNNTNYLSDIAVSVTYTLTTMSTWSNSTSFTTGFSLALSASIPKLFDVESTVTAEFNRTTAMGAENTESTQLTSTCTVKDVEPGVRVRP